MKLADFEGILTNFKDDVNSLDFVNLDDSVNFNELVNLNDTVQFLV